MRLLKIAVTRHALKLPPQFATRMTIGANVAASEPTVIRARLIRTEVIPCIDGAPTSPREPQQRGRRVRRLGTSIDVVLTSFTPRFVEQTSKEFGFFRAFLGGLET
jgi:hypothetical protein